MSRLNRLLTSFGPPDREWCCERCRAAAFVPEHLLGAKHPLPPGEPHTDLPELESHRADVRPRHDLEAGPA